MKKFLRMFSRFIMILLPLTIQVLWLMLVIVWAHDYYIYILIASYVLEIIFIVGIVNRRGEANYKMLWLLVILLVPIFGVWLYLTCGEHRTSKRIKKRIEKNRVPHNLTSREVQGDDRTKQSFAMVEHLSKMPALHVEECKYYPLGDDMFPDMLEDLKRAKHFIYVEYFIIEKGIFWDSIVEILKEKVKEGVTVKVLYDDIGSISTYSLHSKLELRKAGIAIHAFNPVTAFKFTLNNRDHRKMLIIDNEVCYSGGVNIADEYINKVVRFGHWKDIGFRMTGEGVQAYTHLFLLFWNCYEKEKVDESTLYKPEVVKESTSKVLSYYDSPSNKEPISNQFFINLLGSATKHIYFYTPYLIISDSLREAFIQAAERGIDVRIIIPGIPDKKFPYMFTEKYAEELTSYGVKVYKYSKGFIHAKACLVDERLCTIGTVNLDYRSLYLHFECNTIFTDEGMMQALKTDFLQTQEQSELVDLDKIKHNYFKRLARDVLDIFEPLL